jgi:putative membrane-bound dehydrogenase-like protein
LYRKSSWNRPPEKSVLSHRAPLVLVALSFCPALAQERPAAAIGDGPPVAIDTRLVVERFAAAPDIVHPISLDFDLMGRLLVVESHTHFRPAKYGGPKHDRVRVLEDTDGDGKADKFTTYFEGLTHTMDLAVHPDGSVFVATRNEIIRLRDTDDDGMADEKSRIAFLDTKGNYPHNGLCGLSFDARGDLNFGMGENLGEPYKLTGSDGTILTGGGEGGNVYHCTADGKDLRRVATGFWNPFGSCRDIYGRLFVVDNDPDASPPCRLLHVVNGGDYGFQFRYGRAGRHPFQSWNGELPGTLPMVAGTGESPCEVVSYESDGLPANYRGELLVPAWADHRLERYSLKPKGASFTADRGIFVRGGKDFYPSGLAVAPDGSLFVTDWGSRSYELHGKGAVWHVRWKDAKPARRPAEPKAAIASPDRRTRDAAARELTKSEEGRALLREQLKAKDVRVRAAALSALVACGDRKVDLEPAARDDAEPGLRALAVRGLIKLGDDLDDVLAPTQPPIVVAETTAGWSFERFERALPAVLADQDPHLRHAFIRTLAGSPGLLNKVTEKPPENPRAREGLLLAWRLSERADGPEVVGASLKDVDPDVRLLAVKWVSDEKLSEFRPRIAEMMRSPTLDPRSFLALGTALARLDDRPVNENSLAEYFLERFNERSAAPAARLMALRALPASHKSLRTETLVKSLEPDDPAFRVEVLRALKDRADSKASPAVRAVAADVGQPAAVRAQAVLTLAAMDGGVDAFVALAGDAEPSVRNEALRSLTQSNLTADQRGKLTAAVGKKANAGDLLGRVLGKSLGTGRPDAKDTDAWLKRLAGPADPEAGRRVFEHPKLAGCYRCHTVDGRGSVVGPDLSLIGRTDRRWILQSILQPGSVIAPHYQAWKVLTTDEVTRTGLLVRTYLDESEYVDEKGNRFRVTAGEVAEVRAATVSIMPMDLLDNLTDQEIRDLVAYLESRK